MEKAWMLSGVELRPEAAEEVLRALEEGFTEETKWAEDIPPGVEDYLREGFLPAFTLYGSSLDSFLRWAARGVMPGEVLAFVMEPWDNVPFFGYRVLEEGGLEPLWGALVSREGKVVETLPHPDVGGRA